MKSKIAKQIMNLGMLFFCLLISAATYSFSQDSTFNINVPAGWVQTQNKDLINSMKNNHELSEKVKDEILANAPSIQSFEYVAPSKTGSLYRPNIQVLLIRNQTQNFSEFRLMTEKRLEGIKDRISKLKISELILEPVSEIMADGKRSLYAKITGYLQAKTGDKVQLLSRIYAIPSGKYFYQINMNDSGDYNCEDEFKKVLAHTGSIPPTQNIRLAATKNIIL